MRFCSRSTNSAAVSPVLSRSASRIGRATSTLSSPASQTWASCITPCASRNRCGSPSAFTRPVAASVCSRRYSVGRLKPTRRWISSTLSAGLSAVKHCRIAMARSTARTVEPSPFVVSVSSLSIKLCSPCVEWPCPLHGHISHFSGRVCKTPLKATHPRFKKEGKALGGDDAVAGIAGRPAPCCAGGGAGLAQPEHPRGRSLSRRGTGGFHGPAGGAKAARETRRDRRRREPVGRERHHRRRDGAPVSAGWLHLPCRARRSHPRTPGGESGAL